jgi:hypothetical protein
LIIYSWVDGFDGSVRNVGGLRSDGSDKSSRDVLMKRSAGFREEVGGNLRNFRGSEVKNRRGIYDDIVGRRRSLEVFDWMDGVGECGQDQNGSWCDDEIFFDEKQKVKEGELPPLRSVFR